MEKRIYGRTGHRSTIITLGGAVFMHPVSREEEDDFMKFILNHGINHVDVAPTYGDAEVRLGRWVKEYRKTLFLGCKTNKRTKKEAGESLRQSLKNLQTDYFDIFQLHSLNDPEELKVALSENGAVRFLEEARDRGLVKFIGITGHNPITILEAVKHFDFDAVELPVNYVLRAHQEPKNDYEPVLSLAKERNIGSIAIKTVAKGPWLSCKRTSNTWYCPFSTRAEVVEAVRFTLSQDVTTAAHCSDIKIAKIMIEAAEEFIPMDRKQQQELLLKASELEPLFPYYSP